MVWWGIPMMGLEVIGIPKNYWLPVLFLALPATMLGVFVEALVEHGIVKHLERNKMDRGTPSSPSRPISNS
jgi:hypothetical protein